MIIGIATVKACEATGVCIAQTGAKLGNAIATSKLPSFHALRKRAADWIAPQNSMIHISLEQ